MTRQSGCMDYRDLPTPVILRIDCVLDSLPELITRVAKITKRQMFEASTRGATTQELINKVMDETVSANVDVIIEMKGLSESQRDSLTAAIYVRMDEVREEVDREIQVAGRRAKRLQQDVEYKRRAEQSNTDRNQFEKRLRQRRHQFHGHKKRNSKQG